MHSYLKTILYIVNTEKLSFDSRRRQTALVFLYALHTRGVRIRSKSESESGPIQSDRIRITFYVFGSARIGFKCPYVGLDRIGFGLSFPGLNRTRLWRTD